MREARPADEDDVTGVHLPGKACLPRRRSWRPRPYFRGGRPFCHRLRACAWRRCKLHRFDVPVHTSPDSARSISSSYCLSGDRRTSFWKLPMISLILLRWRGSIRYGHKRGQLAQEGLGDLPVAGMMISPVSELTTSSEIFSPNRMLLRASSIARAIPRSSSCIPLRLP